MILFVHLKKNYRIIKGEKMIIKNDKLNDRQKEINARKVLELIKLKLEK